MSKPALKVDQTLLVSCLQEAEKDGPLANLSQLWQTASQLYNSQKQSDYPEASPSVVMLRVTTGNIPVQTVAGRRGRQAGTTNKTTIKTTQRAFQESQKDTPSSDVDDTPSSDVSVPIKEGSSRSISGESLKLADLLQALHPLTTATNGDVVTMAHPIVIKELNCKVIPFNSVFERISIDKKNLTISVWKGDTVRPDYILEDALEV